MCMYVCACVHVCMCMWVCVYAPVCCVCICVCVYAHVCVYVCVLGDLLRRSQVVGTRAVRRAGPLEPHPPSCTVVSRTSSLAMGSSPGGWDKVGDKGMTFHWP
ncbi:unnamed protein product [Rangifer tarandus platyrhynchus]|uniref:Secreted protein n=2 Tax=Rangifer tarandus platyrhynchus TaxID=3082113 RepID=A0ABN8Y085_RANTA|nr:unnamed protein product [Rangifer tarandus platyrhynchus]